MLKRLSIFACVVLVLSVVMSSFAQDEGSLADVVPAETSLYINLQIDDLLGTAEYILDDLGIENNPVSFSLVELFADQGLQMTSPDAPRLDDLLDWLGSEIAIAGSAEVESVMMGEVPNAGLIAAVDDYESLAAYLETVIENPELPEVPYERGETEVAGVTAITYTTTIPVEGFEVAIQLALWDGYMAFGTVDFVADVITLSQDSANALSNDASYQTVMSGISTDPLISVYVSDRAFREALLGVDTVAPDTVPEEAVQLVEAFTGVAFAIGGDADEWVIQYTHHLDIDAVKAIFPDLPDMDFVPNSEAAAAFLPDRALATFMYGDYNGVFNYVVDFAKAVAPAFDWTAEEIEEEIATMESEIAEETDLSLREDILSWMTGSYGQAVFYNPNSDLACDFGGVGIDFVGGMVTSDADATDHVFTTLVDIAMAEEPDINMTETDDGLYMFEEDGVAVVFGRDGDLAVGGTSSGMPFLQSAIAGEGALVDSPVWERAMTIVPVEGKWPILYVNLLEVRTLLEAAVDMGLIQDESDLQAANIFIGTLRPFESALIYGDSSGSGNFTVTASMTTAREDVTALPALEAPERDPFVVSGDVIAADNAANLASNGTLCSATLGSSTEYIDVDANGTLVAYSVDSSDADQTRLVLSPIPGGEARSIALDSSTYFYIGDVSGDYVIADYDPYVFDLNTGTQVIAYGTVQSSIASSGTPAVAVDSATDSGVVLFRPSEASEAGTYRYEVVVVDLTTGEETNRFEVPFATQVYPSNDSISLGGKILMVASSPETYVINIEDGSIVQTFEVSSYRDVGVSPDGRLAYISGSDGFQLYDVASGELHMTMPASAAESVDFNRDGSLMVLGFSRDFLNDTPASVQVMTAEFGESIITLTPEIPIRDVYFSADDSAIIVEGYNNRVEVFTVGE